MHPHNSSHKLEGPGSHSESFTKIPHNVVDFPMPDKGLATLKAQLALAGHQVHEGSNDDFIVTRWGMSKHCPDIGALRRFARVLGVSS